MNAELHSVGRPRNFGLVGCVKEKTSSPHLAKDLYVSPLFLGRRAYVERTCEAWRILSAEYGLVDPDELLQPYDKALKDLGRQERRAWTKDVLAAIDIDLQPAPGDIFEIHAGAEYRDFGLVEGLISRGCHVENPTEGLRIGNQLQFYKQAREEM